MERSKIWYWMSHLQAVPIHKLNQIIGFFSDPEELLVLSDRQLEQFGVLSKREQKIIALHRDNRQMILESYEQLKEQEIQFVSFEETHYPELLKQLPDRPIGLFVKGKLPKKENPCVAIVGARACSEYGKECAQYFGKILAELGIQIISGMAYGIDSAAQRAAIKERGRSYAVLGGGVDICYPQSNFDLYTELSMQGGVISEMIPKTQGKPYLFARRNRIISGMCEAVIVVEARERSGSLITADIAVEQGKLVYAVPGRIDSSLSEGCHHLIRNGAILLQKPEELLEDLKMTLEISGVQEFATGRNELTIQERDVYNCLTKEPLHVEELLFISKYPISTLMYVLLQLEIKGYVCQNPKNYYRKTRLIPPKSNVGKEKECSL